MHLIEPEESIYYTITNQSGQDGWVAELRVKPGDIVLHGRILIIDKLKETKKISNNSLNKTQKKYSWSINEKLTAISKKFAIS